MTDERRAQVERALAQTRARIDRAARAAGREPDDIAVVAVTKRFPASDVELLASLGLTDVAENRHQEAAAKHAEVVDNGTVQPRWHFIGQLQTNKARAVTAYIDSVDSVDRESLVRALGAGARSHGRTVDCLVQVSLAPPEDDASHRGGCPPQQARALADQVAQTEGLRLAGVMGMAPLDGDPHAAYTLLSQIARQIQADHPDARVISAGMSGDLEQAVAAGATHVRLGTALLGERPALR